VRLLSCSFSTDPSVIIVNCFFSMGVTSGSIIVFFEADFYVPHLFQLTGMIWSEDPSFFNLYLELKDCFSPLPSQCLSVPPSFSDSFLFGPANGPYFDDPSPMQASLFLRPTFPIFFLARSLPLGNVFPFCDYGTA